jgi:Domain of unknown function (DUF4337)
MSEATELLEKMEHAGHGGGHGEGGHKGPGTFIGITMAVLGVMLAVCAAMVGTERTELIKGTIDQSNKWGIYQAEATKSRVMEADSEMLHALTPNKAELKKFDEKLASVKRAGGKSDAEDTAEIKDALHVATTELADLLTPDQDDEDRIQRIGTRYKHDMAEAKEDAESYESAIEAHYEASEWYERAQLCAEVGIVVASIALLLSSRLVWIISILFGIASGGIIGRTYVHTTSAVRAAEKKIEDAKKHAAELEKDDDDDDTNDGKKPEAKPGADPKKPEAEPKKPEGDKKPGADKTAPHP